MKIQHSILILLLFFLFSNCSDSSKTVEVPTLKNYGDLVEIFKEWRTFEQPPIVKGAPDYSAATFKKRLPAFKSLQAKLLAFDTTGWDIPSQVDWLYFPPILVPVA